MTGTVIHRPRPCHCEPPVVQSQHGHGWVPNEPVGTIWLCECGEQWKAYRGLWIKLAEPEKVR